MASAASVVAAAPSGSMDRTGGEGAGEMTLTVRWSGREYAVHIFGDETVSELKRRICEVTGVLPKRQKLLYPKLAAKLGDDSVLLVQLNLKPSVKMTMIGTTEDEIIVDQGESSEVVDDFTLGQDEVTDIKDKEVNKQKLWRRINRYKIKLLNPCREGKKLLVLDIDYTLFDHRSPAENPLELMRPYLHEFLSSVYASYDIMIWSATSNPGYKITALLDLLAMITVVSDSHGTIDCKPLGLIWAHFPEFYSPRNTIMFDDLRRNFVMNPRNGLTIRPFRKAHLNRGTDDELARLTQYLLAISDLADISRLDHRNWESYVEVGPKRRVPVEADGPHRSTAAIRSLTMKKMAPRGTDRGGSDLQAPPSPWTHIR
ncbi:unnamed protein product [Spirodela intermedia]|uniref:protein-serine/threonine phosphatase n=1 Tax=Spirodela intermedia TaxID=51605 RepID=A0A7I8JE50_SPIIN|nr:unnamed protein product [Spirodela intermedia]CAA6668430.1 unnamed protein product [Spirodela intermedia]